MGLKIYELRRRTFVRARQEEVFEFFSAARNLETITPPFLRFQVLTPEPIVLRAGAELNYRLRVRGVPIRWTTIIQRWDPPNAFSDFQKRGPYALWHHTHRFEAGDGGTWMEDHVRYALPLGLIGQVVQWLVVRRDVEAIFDYRARRIGEVFGGGGRG